MRFEPGLTPASPAFGTQVHLQAVDADNRMITVLSQDNEWLLGYASTGDVFCGQVYTWQYWTIDTSTRDTIWTYSRTPERLSEYMHGFKSDGPPTVLRVYRNRIIEDMPSNWAMFPPESAWPPGMEKVDVGRDRPW